jgi:hypothetical protein
MQLIELMFGVSPDGGTGSLELLLFAAPLIAAAALLKWRRIRSKR